MFAMTTTFIILSKHFFHPLFAILAVWGGLIFVGLYFNLIFRLFTDKTINWVYQSWNILLTFIFITFTRLFFRSGSNLDPVEANETAWEPATNMIRQIGSPWNLDTVPTMIFEYKNIILVFALGMIIHWLPDRFKRLYRYVFANFALPIQIILTALSVFLIYQFMSADSQPFIYFQF